MIPQSFEYSAPGSLKEALALLSREDTKVLAGGMSLIPMMKLRLAAPGHIVDLSRVPDLSFIREEEGWIRVGAMTRHHELEESGLLRSKCPLLAEAAGHIGDQQVRNVGTIGGSIAHADPAADYPASLLALEAKVRLMSAHGQRALSLEDFLVDTLTTAIEPGEIVLDLGVPIESPGTGVSYQKLVNAASGFAVVGAAARVHRSAGKLDFVRVGITGMGPKAFRARNVERLLEGTAGSADDIQRAAAVVAEGIEANSDLHASADYRRHVAKIYTTRALTQAVSRLS